MASTTPGSVEEKETSRKPRDTKFKQQKLPAWQPILTASTVLPAFFAIGLAFIPLGVALLVTSNNIQEVSEDYTDCIQTNSTKPCHEIATNDTTCNCEKQITLTENFVGDVFMYYGLSNFYQNHRRYVKSRDDDQLRGNAIKPGDLSTDCDPFRVDTDGNGYAPCGAIANSMFNDIFTLTYQDDAKTAVNLLDTNIAWASDRDVKFINPASWENYVKPEKWDHAVWEFNKTTEQSNNGYKNEDLIVWMRTAALPTFRKLHRRIDHVNAFRDGLPKGNYVINITYNFMVKPFGGRKRIILTTTSWMGGKNDFLGIAYLVVGSICIILGVVFLVIHLKFGKTDQDMASINSRTPYN